MAQVLPEIKEKILKSVRDDWIAVSILSKEYWVSTVTIYEWLRKEWEQTWWNNYNLWEIKRLKKDKEDLLLIIWELTAELNKSKKKR